MAMRALILYHTKTGHTKRAAEDVAAGLRAAGAEPRLAAAADFAGRDVAEEIVVVGSPCRAGSCRIRGGVAGPIRRWLRRLGPADLHGKAGGAFAVNSIYGGHVTVRAIEEGLRGAGAGVPVAGVVVRAGAPLSLYVGPMASEQDRERLRQFGRALVEAAQASLEDA